MAAITPVVADATTSTFDQVKHTVVNAGNWIGRQVQWLASSLKDIVLRVIEAVKPLLASVIQFVKDQSAKVREYIAANPQMAGIALVGTAVVAVTTLAGYFFCCNTTPEAKEGTKKADAK